MADPTKPKQSRKELLDKVSSWRRESLKGILYTKSLGWKRLAIKKGVPYKVTNKELAELFEFQGGRCALSGVTFSIGNYNIRDGAGDPLAGANTMSLIRKDPNSPYEIGNLMLVTFQVAQSVGLWGVESMVDMAANVVRRQLTNSQIEALCG